MKNACVLSLPCLLALFGMGCSVSELAVDAQADVMEQAYPSIEEQTDYEFARAGIPGNLLQVDGLLHLAPEDQRLLLIATQGLTSYAFGFIEDDFQEAELAGDLDRADGYRFRARDTYLKAKDYGLRLLRLKNSDFPEKLPLDPDDLKKLLEESFTEPEAARALLWVGNAWGSAANVSRDDPALVSDLPFAKAFVERSVALDENYYHATGHMVLGLMESTLGASVGGNPGKGRDHFEKALALTNREALLVQVSYAATYAVQKQDKKLFIKLVDEVLNATAPKRADLSLPNAIAQRRAARLKAQADTLILDEVMTPLPTATADGLAEPTPAAPEDSTLAPTPAPAKPNSK